VFAARSGKREDVTLARAVVAERESKPDANWPPGAVREDGLIQTGQGSVRLIELQPAGRRLMRFEDFVRGRQVAPPDRFLRWEPK
jgi:methionyl-tRNA formyltransferase